MKDMQDLEWELHTQVERLLYEYLDKHYERVPEYLNTTDGYSKKVHVFKEDDIIEAEQEVMKSMYDHLSSLKVEDI